MKANFLIFTIIYIISLNIKCLAQVLSNDSVKIEIIMSDAILKQASVDVRLIGDIAYTPDGFLLLASAEQIYILGKGGIVQVLQKPASNITAFTIQTGMPVAVCDYELCYIDTLGTLSPIFSLPFPNAGIITDNEDITYIFDRIFMPDKKEYVVYQLMNDSTRFTRILSTPAPITSICKYKTSLLIATENKILCADTKSKKYFDLFSLVQKEDTIISIVGDTINHALYFSTDSIIYRIRDGKLEYVSTDLGGILKYDGEGLLIFNPEKSLIVRLRNNILYPSTIAEEEAVTIVPSPESTNELTALDYITPIKSLVDFFAKQSADFRKIVEKWQQNINTTTQRIQETNAVIIQLENELNEKKNLTTKGSSQDINALKNNLSNQRTIYKVLKKEMAVKGTMITKQLDEYGKKELTAINQQFNNTRKQIVPASIFPATGKLQIPVAFSEQAESVDSAYYLKPANELLIWHYNVELSFREIINRWNQKAAALIEKDKILLEQSLHIENQMNGYKQYPKTHKKEMVAAKKEMSRLEKERKAVAKQMKADSKELSDYLKSYCSEIQVFYKERIRNVMDDINFLFQEKTNL